MKSNHPEKTRSSKKPNVPVEKLELWFLQQVTPKDGNNYICEVVCHNLKEAWEIVEAEYGKLPRWKEGRSYGFRIQGIGLVPDGREMPPFNHLKKITPIQQKAKYRGKK